MKDRIAIVCLFSIIIVIYHSVIHKEVYARDILKMDITTESGQAIAVREESIIYSAVALKFSPVTVENGQLFYSLSVDNGNTFGGYVLTENNNVILYPDDKMSEDNFFVIRFKYVCDQDCDDNGNYREYLSTEYSVKFDLSPPAISLVNSEITEEWLTDYGTLKLQVVDEEGLIGRIVAFDKGNVVYEEHFSKEDSVSEFDFEVPLLNEGENNEVEVTIYDFASNQISTVIPYKMDRTPPVISVDVPGELEEINEGTAITVNDNCLESTWCEYEVSREYEGEVTIDSVIVSCADNRGRIPIDMQGEGKYVVNARAYDMAGNSSEDITAVKYVDTASPDITIGGVGSDTSNAEPIDVSIRVHEPLYENCNVSVTALRSRQSNQENLDLTSFEMGAPTEERQIKLKRDGDYTIYVKATDAAGHESVQTTNFRIDRKAPELYLVGINEGEVTNQIPVIRAHIRDTFYDTTTVKLDLYKKNSDGIFVSNHSIKYDMVKEEDEYDYRISEEGEYELTCVATDSTGNRTEKTLNFSVDITPPIIKNIEELDGNYYKSYEFPNDMEAYVDDSAKVNVEAFINNTKLSGNEVVKDDGRYILWIGAIDEAGNYAEKSAEFIIDKTKPQILVKGISKESRIKKGNQVSISLINEEDILEGVYLNGRKMDITDSSSADIVIEDYGEYSIEVMAHDKAGNDTDKMIKVSCVEDSNSIPFVGTNMVLSRGAVIDMPWDSDTGEIDYVSLIIGLIVVLSATAGLVYRAVFKM